MAAYADHIVPPYLQYAREIRNSLPCEFFILSLLIIFVISSEYNWLNHNREELYRGRIQKDCIDGRF
jgi:hypothetical protein